MRLTPYLGLLALAACCAWPAAAQDDPAALSDEFGEPATLGLWLQVHRVEGGSGDQLQRLDLGQTRPGWLTLVPRTVVWYQDWRGPLLHKRVQGDFVVTTRLAISNRAGTGAPGSQFSLGGVLVRAPREVTPQTWQPGGENYVFLSLGAAQHPGQFEWETKTTVNSRSTLRVTPAGGGEGTIRIARVGPHLLLLKRDGEGPWTLHQRYYRPDLPAELQVGLTVYTDWPTASRTPPQRHNFMALDGGNPDLVAAYDYVRFARPQVPPTLANRPLADPRQVGDHELLAWLGVD